MPSKCAAAAGPSVRPHAPRQASRTREAQPALERRRHEQWVAQRRAAAEVRARTPHALRGRRPAADAAGGRLGDGRLRARRRAQRCEYLCAELVVRQRSGLRSVRACACVCATKGVFRCCCCFHAGLTRAVVYLLGIRTLSMWCLQSTCNASPPHASNWWCTTGPTCPACRTLLPCHLPRIMQHLLLPRPH